MLAVGHQPAGLNRRTLPPLLRQDFHAPWRIRALLPALWCSCRSLEVEAEFLQLGEVPAEAEVYEVRLGKLGREGGPACRGACCSAVTSKPAAPTMHLRCLMRRRRRPSPACMQDEGADPAAMAELLSRLAVGMGAGTPLRRLAVNRDGHFALPSLRLPGCRGAAAGACHRGTRRRPGAGGAGVGGH